MYLHKNGCKYYQKVFEVAYLRTKSAIESLKTQGKQNPTLNDIFNYDGIDITHEIKRLLEHSEDIEKNIENEKDVLRNILNSLHRIMFTEKNVQITDPTMLKLTKFAQELPEIYNRYKSLTSILKKTLEYIQPSNSSNDIRHGITLSDNYKSIYDALTKIYDSNMRMAYELRNIIAFVEKEKEMIKKEEEILNDFDKNMMSWF